jgi:hypothetical protein
MKMSTESQQQLLMFSELQNFDDLKNLMKAVKSIVHTQTYLLAGEFRGFMALRKPKLLL